MGFNLAFKGLIADH